MLSIPLSLAGHVAGVICGVPFAAGLLDGVAAPALALGVLACVDSARHARRPSLRLALVAAALVTAREGGTSPRHRRGRGRRRGVAVARMVSSRPRLCRGLLPVGAGVLAALAADSATDPISFLLAGAAAALTAMTWATRLGSLAGAALAVAAMAAAAAASAAAAWLAEDLRAAADASTTPGWAALKRFLGPPDGEGRVPRRAHREARHCC